jgi:hypothetical protein
MTSQRLNDLRRFYDLLAELELKTGGPRYLSACDGRLSWPQRGVYFFMEQGENRSDSGTGPRIVRVGTHALRATSRATLWRRLSQHRGVVRSGGGNHRGSIFRLIVGTALIGRGEHSCATWDNGKSNASPEIRVAELSMERAVSQCIGAMPFLWLPVDDAPGRDSKRVEIERNSIALLSNFAKDRLDPPSTHWLGRSCSRARVRESGLWNNFHVDEHYDPGFLDRLTDLVNEADR